MVSPEEKDTPVQFGHILHILLDIQVMGKHEVSTVDHDTILRNNRVPVCDESLVHLTPGLEWSVTVPTDVEVTEMGI